MFDSLDLKSSFRVSLSHLVQTSAGSNRNVDLSYISTLETLVYWPMTSEPLSLNFKISLRNYNSITNIYRHPRDHCDNAYHG